MEHSGNSTSDTEAMLDLLARSTGDYYFIADFTESTVVLSENAVIDFALDRTTDLKSHIGRVSLEDVTATLHELEKLRHSEVDTATFLFHIETPQHTIRHLYANAKRFSSQDSPDSEQVMGLFKEISNRETISPFEGILDIRDLLEDLDHSFRNDASGYLLLLDIDNLKTMNFRYGYSYSDESLRDLISSMKRATEGKHPVYHVLGDSLAMILDNYSESEVRKLFFTIQGEASSRMTVSGGCIALDEYPVPNAETLLQHAESALYISKLSGKAILNFFSPQDYATKLRKLELQEELEESIHSGFRGFFLVYQPQVRSRTYELFGAEALLRFRSRERGVVSPDEFIPILEDTGMICQVGLWVLEEALKTLSKWRRYHPSFMISVNMSHIQMQDDNVGHHVLDILKKSGCDGNSLIMEITESSRCMDYPRMNSIFKLLKSAGITISADDFGTGYSGLDRIRMADFDEIKIDRSFVSSIGKLSRDYRFLCNMMNLAADAGLRVVCEGVELEDELEALERLQPSLLQGFLFSKPITAEEFEKTYFDPTSELFRKRIRRDSYLRERNAGKSGREFRDEDAKDIVKPVFDSIDDAIFITNADTGNLIYMNKTAMKLLDEDNAENELDTPDKELINEILARKMSNTCMFKSRNGETFLEKDFMKVQDGMRMRVTILIDITDNFRTDGAQGSMNAAART